MLSDGGTAHVRPIRPDDADMLRSFYSRLSAESIYFRYFGPRPRLTDKDVVWFTNVDYDNRVALIATIGTEMVAVVRYDRVQPRDHAEVAFLVEDAHQGRGVAAVLMEHLRAAARERGIKTFIADVLPGNHRMMGLFRQAGYTAQSQFEDGVVRMTLDLSSTETALEVRLAREHRAEARSIARLLTPESVAVIGASREPGGIGQTVLRNLLAADFTGPVYPVHRHVRAVAGVRAYRSVSAIDGEVDLAVLAVPAEGVLELVEECAEKGVKGLVVVSSGFGETGPEGRARQEELVRIARAYGIRVVGPNCLGIANTDPAVRLNATLAATLPGRGRVGFFSQSGALGTALLQRVAQRGMGISTFVSAGNRADVSGNDLLQYWEEDPATDVILLYLESIGNPRKFTRLARRISRSKPIVVVKSRGVPGGHRAPVLALPDTALSSLFAQAGVIRVDDLVQLFDVGQLLAHQPLPAGPRVGVVGNSDALTLLAEEACADAGLQPGVPVNLGARAGAAEFAAALRSVLPQVDAAVAIYMPPIPGDCREVAEALLEVARESGKPVLATFQGALGMPVELRVTDGPGDDSPNAGRSRRTPPRRRRFARWHTSCGTPSGAGSRPARSRPSRGSTPPRRGRSSPPPWQARTRPVRHPAGVVRQARVRSTGVRQARVRSAGVRPVRGRSAGVRPSRSGRSTRPRCWPATASRSGPRTSPPTPRRPSPPPSGSAGPWWSSRPTRRTPAAPAPSASASPSPPGSGRRTPTSPRSSGRARRSRCSAWRRSPRCPRSSA